MPSSPKTRAFGGIKRKIMNTYTKYCPNVFVAKCDDPQHKGNTITLTTKYGKEHECIVFNYLGKTRDEKHLYSIVRADGYNVQERAKAKAERYKKWGESAANKSHEKWKESHEGRDFLALGEPIKVGHHSEKRHRALIERNHNRMSKSVELQEKADEHISKAEYWKSKTNEINLSMPESVEYYECLLEEAKMEQEAIRAQPKEEREHSYSLHYATKRVKEVQKKYELAQKLWA